MPILDVPYFMQPTPKTCQSTVLKMFATYIDIRRAQPAQERDILSIYGDVNGDPSRPSQVKNAWVNFQWWLRREFPDMTFLMDTGVDSATAITTIRSAIANGSPVLVSTNQNVHGSGHVILVVGVMRFARGRLEEPLPGPVGQDFVFIVHDPFGRFGQQFLPAPGGWGPNRHVGGYSTAHGEYGPGRAVWYTLEGIRRRDASFLLIRTPGLA